MLPFTGKRQNENKNKETRGESRRRRRREEGGREVPASEAAVEKSGTKFLNILLTIEWRRKEKLRRRCTVMMLVGYRSLINGLDLF